MQVHRAVGHGLCGRLHAPGSVSRPHGTMRGTWLSALQRLRALAGMGWISASSTSCFSWTRAAVLGGRERPTESRASSTPSCSRYPRPSCWLWTAHGPDGFVATRCQPARTRPAPQVGGCHPCPGLQSTADTTDARVRVAPSRPPHLRSVRAGRAALDQVLLPVCAGPLFQGPCRTRPSGRLGCRLRERQ